MLILVEQHVHTIWMKLFMICIGEINVEHVKEFCLAYLRLPQMFVFEVYEVQFNELLVKENLEKGINSENIISLTDLYVEKLLEGKSQTGNQLLAEFYVRNEVTQALPPKVFEAGLFLVDHYLFYQPHRFEHVRNII